MCLSDRTSCWYMYTNYILECPGTQGVVNSSQLEFTRPWIRFPAGPRCVFFLSDPAVRSSILVGAEREENLSAFLSVGFNSNS